MSGESLRWGVVGVGRAGAARARAIQADPRATLVAGFGGDPAKAGLEVAESLEQLLAQVDAVAICSPDTAHPLQVAAALNAGRHVVCEFPLAGSADEAQALLDAAKEADRVLHTEHIELLGGAATWLRFRTLRRTCRGASLRFVGAPRTRIFSLAHANLARLHRLFEAVGPAQLVAVDEAWPEEVHGRLALANKAEVSFSFRFQPDSRRRFEMMLELDDGAITQVGQTVFDAGKLVTLPPVPGLFERDQLAASARILDGAPPYVSDERVVAVLRLADEIALAHTRVLEAHNAKAQPST